MKTKIKSDRDEATYFDDTEIPKVDSDHTCLAVISLNSALNKDKDRTYYPQVFLRECKYIFQKVIRQINDIWGIFLILTSLMKNKLG